MKALTTWVLGHLPLGLGVALLATSAFAWVQTFRLGACQETFQAQKASITVLTERARADAAALAQRDALIQKQNDAVRSVLEQQAAYRAAYLVRLDQADKRARVLQAQAADIMQRTTTAADELGRCQAALGLVEDVVGKE